MINYGLHMYILTFKKSLVLLQIDHLPVSSVTKGGNSHKHKKPCIGNVAFNSNDCVRLLSFSE